MAVALAAIGANVHVLGAERRAHDPDPRPAPAARRQAAARHRAQRRRPDHRGRARRARAARSTYRKVRDRACFAFAVFSVAAAVELDDGAVQDAGSRSAASPTCRGGARARGGRRCAAREPTAEAFAAAADAELEAAQPLRDNAFKVPLARNVLVADARGADRVSVADDRASAPPLAESTAASRSPARRATRSSTPIEGVAYAVPVQSPRSPRGEIAAVDADAALGAPGVLAVICARQRAARSARPTTASSLLLPVADEVAYRGQIVAAVVAETLEAGARGRRGSCASTTSRAPHDVVLRADHPRALQAGQGQPGVPGGHRAGRRRSRRSRGRGGPDRRDLPHARRIHNNAMEPHATLALWEDGDLLAPRLHPGRLRRAPARSPRCSSSSPSACA